MTIKILQVYYNLWYDKTPRNTPGDVLQHAVYYNTQYHGRCGVVGSTLAFGSIGHGLESELPLFSHHNASTFRELRSLAKCSLDVSVRQLL